MPHASQAQLRSHRVVDPWMACRRWTVARPPHWWHSASTFVKTIASSDYLPHGSGTIGEQVHPVERTSRHEPLQRHRGPVHRVELRGTRLAFGHDDEVIVGAGAERDRG